MTSPGAPAAAPAALPQGRGTTSAIPSRVLTNCAGVVLAGGLSSRMGRPKAWLPFGGVPLLARVVERLRAAFGEVLVVGAEGQDLPDTGAPVARDRRRAAGPLGGLEVALASVSATAVFAVSCDTPFLQAALARRAAGLAAGCKAGEESFEAVVPSWEGRLNPLLAAYRTSLLPRVTRLLDEGRLRPAFLFQEVLTHVLDEDEIRAVDPDGLSFVNMNGPDEYRTALAAAPPRVAFELFGQPCVLAGAREVEVDVPPPRTLGSALAALAREAPGLVGHVLEPGGAPGAGFLLSAGGREFTRDLERPVSHGDRILVLAASAGG